MKVNSKVSNRFIYFFGAFGGILFGYDIGVMTGALPFLRENWGYRKWIYYRFNYIFSYVGSDIWRYFSW
ncbi:hypothetical protein [Staphylococcus xylosus]|uniref:hypothetical protein n=1 Tax=Staphylococcus xylosus TaxID=1288 RepID=UPI003BF5C0F7